MSAPSPKICVQILNKLLITSTNFAYDVECGIEGALEILKVLRDDLELTHSPDDHTHLIEWQLRQVHRSMTDFQKRMEETRTHTVAERSASS
ncbi:hypothetical protein JCM25156A_32870 [Komagataeibacter kakiaceti JCM 25156]|nr:hypothetical protein [Komagataeibacter sp. FNDCR1]